MIVTVVVAIVMVVVVVVVVNLVIVVVIAVVYSCVLVLSQPGSLGGICNRIESVDPIECKKVYIYVYI
jgi:hypothetical protein